MGFTERQGQKRLCLSRMKLILRMLAYSIELRLKSSRLSAPADRPRGDFPKPAREIFVFFYKDEL
jgi:hypothetical protein